MITRDKRPNHQELGYFASLITPNPDPAIVPLKLAPRDFLRLLDYHGITLLALEQGRLPDEVVSLLGPRKSMMVANEQLKLRALTQMFDAFQAAGLDRSILFKGGALAYSVYAQPWLRPRSDIDCLIDEHEHPEFANILFDLGYQKLFAIEGKHVSYQHTYSKQLAGQSVMNVDVHWRINNRQTLAKSYHVDQLLADCTRLNSVSSSIKVPHPVDSLLISSLHRLGHHHNEERLTWLHDVHLLTDQLDTTDWQTLCDKAEQKKLAGITLDALKFTQRLFDSDIPKTSLDQLRTSASQREPSQIYLKRDLSEWRYFLSDVAALDGWKNKLNLIWENMFPSPDYVRQQMGTKSALRAYTKRALRGILRITR